MPQSKRILIIDDEVNVVNMLRMNLVAEDFQVATAYDGMEGLLHIQTDPPDLIICDVMMPRMDGLELCNQVRSDTATDAIPFIFLTARTEKVETLEGFQMGADDYITKPFDMDMLLAKVHAIFNRLDRVRERDQDIFKDTSRDLNRLSSLGVLSASIAHEIRNQLSSVVSSAEMIRFVQDGEEKEEYAEVVVQQIERINKTINSMLNFAKGRKDSLEPHALHQIVAEAVQLTQPRILSEDVIITVDIPESLPLILADRQQICQVIVNLIINATQALMKHGQIVVTADHEGHYLALQISDNGIGIPEDLKKSLFEPFITTRKESGGIGLGLYISKEIIEAHGGHILVQSHPGEGACFTIQLPVITNDKLSDSSSVDYLPDSQE